MPPEKRRFTWRKVIQFVGVLLLAIICPFAAILSIPKSRKRNTDDAKVEGHLE